MNCLYRAQSATFILCLAATCVLYAQAAPRAQVAPQVTVSSTGIEETRSTEHSASIMKVAVEVKGDVVRRATAVRTVLTVATDETGRNLVATAESIPYGNFQGEFDTISRSNRASGDDNIGASISMKCPALRATRVRRIVGNVEFYVPNNDPQSVVTRNLDLQTGKSVAAPVLRTHGITVVVWTKEGYDQYKANASKINNKALTKSGDEFLADAFGEANRKYDTVALQVKDPHVNLVGIDFEDAQGKPLHSQQSVMGSVREAEHQFDFDQKRPSGTRIKLYVATPKSIVKVPFELKDLPLP